MALEIGLNRVVRHTREDEMEFRARRDRERTYLILFVHDRSLAMQTGRPWMLPEDELVKSAPTWHESEHARPEDVIVSAQVQLRRIAVSLALLVL